MIRLNSPRGRSGSILIVVIGMLALFAVVGLSFVLYADAQATAARSGRAARNQDAPPDPEIPANDFLKQLFFGTSDTTSALLGNDLLSARFEAGSNVPYTGIGMATPTTVNHTGGAAPTGRAVPWTYPDANNFYLSWIDPTTGEVKVPSFHRHDIFGVLDSSNSNWSSAAAKSKTLRPIPALHPNFPRIPANADGTYSGDVANLKFMTGAQKNDSLWMYTGAPVQTWRGRQYVAMVAPIVIDLSGRVNPSIAGNNGRPSSNFHETNQGFGQWEIDPTTVGITQAELSALIAARQKAATVPGDRANGWTFGRINVGRNTSNPAELRAPPKYSRIDADSNGSGVLVAPGTTESPTLPAAGNPIPFPSFPPRFDHVAGALTNHPSMFNPFQWPRGLSSGTAHGFGMDDLVKLGTRYSDPKNRYASSEIATQAPTSMANADTRMLTTAFSVSQRWGQIVLPAGQGTLGPIDINRPLPEFRKDVSKPLSSTNVWNVAVAAEKPYYDNGMISRQNLAMDIFVRLMACETFIDGTNVKYTAATYNGAASGLTIGPATPAATLTLIKRLAQLAVNMVDYIDGDDIMTPFHWNTADATAIVFGTELPKLVVNEAYCGLFNERNAGPAGDSPPQQVTDPVTKKKTSPAKKELHRKYWVELHNPLSSDTVLPDGGAARLAPAAGTPAINPYEIDIFEEVTAGATAFTTFLNTDPSYAAKDVMTAAGVSNVAGLTARARINNFAAATANATLTAAGADERNLVHPADATTGVAGVKGNRGYFVIGAHDQPNGTGAFPDAYEASQSLTFPDPTASGAQNSTMTYTTGDLPLAATITAAKATSHTIVLRRLANPYIAAQTDPTLANYNPYVAVDYLEHVPTRDRVLYDTVDDRKVTVGAGFAVDTGASIGRNHAYAAAPVLNAATGPAVALQTGNATPAHTFFLKNSNYTAANPVPWLVHMDRELVNATELLPVSIYSPAQLTHKFYNGTSFNVHNHVTAGTYGAMLDTTAFGANIYKAFDLLTVASRLPQVPLGGREPGLININMIPDAKALPAKSVWNALMVPQGGNTYPLTFAASTWNTLYGIRSSSGIIGSLSDKPFQPFSSTATGAAIGSTILGSATAPTLFNPTPLNTNGGTPHPYFQAEPMRKIMNNTTTVTDGFLVIWTVGFFEVDPPGTAPGTLPIQIGKELYERVPGDLRAQYSAVVDRSMATVAVNGNPATTAPFTKPWESKLTENAVSGGTNTIVMQGTLGGGGFTIYNGDGSLSSPVTTGSQIRIGYGDAATGTGDGEWVIVGVTSQALDSSNTPIPGQIKVAVTPLVPPLKYHGAGTRVSNSLLGNPGPQTTFDCNAPANRHLVPYYIRMQP